jgi:hypothetical protein
MRFDYDVRGQEPIATFRCRYSTVPLTRLLRHHTQCVICLGGMEFAAARR